MLNTLKYPEYKWNIVVAGLKLAWSILNNGISQLLVGGILLIYAAVKLLKCIRKRLHNEHLQVLETNVENEIL